MFSKTLGNTISKTIALELVLFTVLLASASFSQTKFSQPAPGQPKPAASSAAGPEFPVLMRQNVAAGTTLVGTKVQAQLAVSTLVNGVVVPRDAILSGEVTESVAKSASTPSRLAIRMDSAQWKNRSTPMVFVLAPKVYLTAWYYPPPPLAYRDLPSGLPDADQHPRLSSEEPGISSGKQISTPASMSLPGTDTDKLPAPKHRVLMKDVESTRNSEGAVTLTSKHSNIKLDKTTTYVLATGNLAGGPG